MQEYLLAVAADPQLDPTIDVAPQNSSLPPSVPEEPEAEQAEEQRTVAAEEPPTIPLPSTSTSAITRKRRRRQSENSVEIVASGPKRPSLSTTELSEMPRYPLRDHTSPPQQSHATEEQEWRKIAQELLAELKRNQHSVFFREPVNVREYLVGLPGKLI